MTRIVRRNTRVVTPRSRGMIANRSARRVCAGPLPCVSVSASQSEWLRSQLSGGMTPAMAADRTDELRRLTQRFFRRFGALAADVTPCGKPMPMAHAHALLVLLARGELSQQELGEELGIDKSNVARLCAKMVAARQASQRTSESDGRSRRIALTARGERLAREVDAASRERFHALLEALPEDRRDPVIESLRHLVAALEHTPSPERKPE